MRSFLSHAGIVALLVLQADLLVAKNKPSVPVMKSTTYDVTKQNSKVEFSAVGNPGFIRINGTEGHAAGTLRYDPTAKTIDGKVVVAMEDFTTDMSMRDRHMKEKYLEVPKFPEAELSFNSAPLDLSHSKVSTSIPAELTLHGVKKPVTVKANIDNAESDSPHLDATFQILLTDYGIAIPSFAGVTVAKDVDVKVSLDPKKAKE